MSQAGSANANFLCDLCPCHISLNTLSVQRRIKLPRVEPQNPVCRDVRQARIGLCELLLPRYKTLWRSIEPAEHLQDTIALSYRPGARAGDRRWAKRTSRGTARLPTDFLRRLRP